jgi:hypothetical protein
VEQQSPQRIQAIGQHSEDLPRRPTSGRPRVRGGISPLCRSREQRRQRGGGGWSQGHGRSRHHRRSRLGWPLPFGGGLLRRPGRS